MSNFDCYIDHLKKVIVKLIEIGVEKQDEQILELASGIFDSNSKDFEKQKKDFLSDIHRILGY